MVRHVHRLQLAPRPVLRKQRGLQHMVEMGLLLACVAGVFTSFICKGVEHRRRIAPVQDVAKHNRPIASLRPVCTSLA
eukprot:8498360-Alexandrium_andersonii.AAC.1